MSDLTRYGLKWTGPEDFVAKPMPDGYWTPYLEAKERIEALKAEQDKIKTAISLWLDGHQSATRVLYQIRDILGVK